MALVGATVYHQEGDDPVEAELPAVVVAETLMMYTTGGNEGIERLAATTGGTDRDQTSRTVFRNRRQAGSTLRAAEGVTMLNLRAVDGAVPDPGGFRYAPPGGGRRPPGGLRGDTAPGVADPEETVRNATDDPAAPDGTVGEAVDDADPEGGNVTGPVTGTGAERTLTDAADGATAVEPADDVEGEADDATGAVDNAGEGNGSAADPTGSRESDGDGVGGPDERARGADGGDGAGDGIAG